MSGDTNESTHSLSAGTLAGTGTFRCESCGFPVALQERDPLPECPHCGADRFARQSLFAFAGEQQPIEAASEERPAWLAEAREALDAEGDYLAFEDGDRVRVVRLDQAYTRLGRSPAADVQFDDATVSRRHALVRREQGRDELLDDCSLNDVFVNGARCEWSELGDGDEILIGRFRLYFVRRVRGRERRPEGTRRAIA